MTPNKTHGDYIRSFRKTKNSIRKYYGDGWTNGDEEYAVKDSSSFRLLFYILNAFSFQFIKFVSNPNYSNNDSEFSESSAN